MQINKFLIIWLHQEDLSYLPILFGKVVDAFTLKPTVAQATPNTLIAGTIDGVDDEFVYLRVTEGFDTFLIIFCDRLFDINFHGNRRTFQMQHNTLKWMKMHHLFEILIKNPLFNEEACSSNHPHHNLSCEVALNESQKEAVENIVAHNRTIPFLLFGPPGTGKTRTIVAAVHEIVWTTKNCVLICAQSNAASDEITERLLDVLNSDEVFRMYAKSFDKEKISNRIKLNCNLSNGDIQFPSLEYMYQFRAVICTLQTAGCIATARGKDKNFNSSHFSHVIIDEAACIHEIVTMIPIAGA